MSAGDPERGRSRRVRWITRAGGVLLRGLAHTWRMRVVNDHALRELRARRQPVIYILWHGRLLPLLWHHRGQGVTVLISEHADGEIVARVAQSLGYRTARGSTTRGGERALLGAVRALEDGGDAAFTPDGPRGPAETFAPGALLAAQRSGAPLIPITATASRAWRLRSWDRFLIPKPFARVTVTYGDPVYVRAANAREAAAQAPRLELLLRELSTGQDREVGHAARPPR